jgi:class 3 adenylate cyclase
MDDVRTDAAAAAYRGFLFSDLRGFTAFAERYGNSAAAAKVGRFLDIARTAIARHEGAEVKTEGDAIHAVFPSASSAVLCGLEIADAAAQLGPREPDGWFDLGVGVHAGEAVETAEGYIGSAVNVAARLCSAARPGEVLVSSTVKGITQASIPVGFIAKGRRRLKGIREPVEIFAVTRDTTARARTVRVMPGSALAGGAGLGLLAVVSVVAIAALVGSQLNGSPSPSVTASPAATMAANPVAIGPLDLGTYRSQKFLPTVTFEIGAPGWSAARDLPDVLGLVRTDAPRGGVYFVRVKRVIADPCTDEGGGTKLGPSATSLLTQLENLQHLTVSPREPVQVGGYAGNKVEIAVDEGVLAACGGLVGADVPLLVAGVDILGFSSGERFTLISVGVGDQAVAVVISADWDQIPSVDELEDLLAIGQSLVASVRF